LIKNGRLTKSKGQPSTLATPLPPAYSAPSSSAAALGGDSELNVSPSTLKLETSSQQAMMSFPGATSVQENPFDVDLYMLQQSRDQNESGGISTFKPPVIAPTKPSRIRK
jgi:hypothetical protein